eukprot:5513090-Amphidinium_carterae.1
MAQATSSQAEVEPGNWEEALRLGSRSVRLTERLLSRSWLLPFPLPVEDPQADPAGEPEQSAEFTELIILGLYWGHALPTQPPHSVLLALPEIAAAGVEGATVAAAQCCDAQGVAVGDASCAMVLASADYVSRHLGESSPLDSNVIAFMEEVPGCLPVASALFVDEHIPAASEAGTWLYLDEQQNVRMRTQGVVGEEAYQSAVEPDEVTDIALLQLQPWLGEAASLVPASRRGKRRPSIVGLGSSAKLLAAALARPPERPPPGGKKAAPQAKVKAQAPAVGQVDPMLQQILAAVSEIGTRVATLESRQQQQPQQQQPMPGPGGSAPRPPSETLVSKKAGIAPPPSSSPWTSSPWTTQHPANSGGAAGFLPCGHPGTSSILAPGNAQTSYQQAVAEAQRLLGTGQPMPPPAPAAPITSRCIPSGLPPGGHTGGSAKAAERERKVDADLRSA